MKKKNFLLRIVVVIGVVLFGGLFFLYMQFLDSANSQNSTAFDFDTPVSVPTDDAQRPLLPLPGSVIEDANIAHTIPLEEIQRGCHTQDCVSAIVSPEFVSASELVSVLDSSSLGILFTQNDESIFYPFPVLESREVVNDVINGEPILVTYSPLTGIGAVFSRNYNGKELEFGVSGMLWQANLLMYNRALDITEQNLWSQILGAAVVGTEAGAQLTMLPSDIVTFADWLSLYPSGKTLATGKITDLYNGKYFVAAEKFTLAFDTAKSALSPEEYIYGILVDGQAKAYPKNILPTGITTDELAGVPVEIIKTKTGLVSFQRRMPSGETEIIPDVESFWFAWKAAYPETLEWSR